MKLLMHFSNKEKENGDITFDISTVNWVTQ